MTEEELKTTGEEVAKELDGKSKEELEAMEVNANEELQKQIYADACKYVWNLMELGKAEDYNAESYAKTIFANVKRNQEEKRALFANWDDQMFSLNQTILIQGYGYFGTEFIKSVFEKDKDSAVVLFETAMQSYLDLKHDYEYLLSEIMEISNAKEQENKKETEQGNQNDGNQENK